MATCADQLEQDEIDIERVKQLLAAAAAESIALDSATLEFTYRKTLERIAEAFAEEPQLARLDRLNRATEALALLPFTVNLWKVQNYFYQTMQRCSDADRQGLAWDDGDKSEWNRCLKEAGEKLAVRVL